MRSYLAILAAAALLGGCASSGPTGNDVLTGSIGPGTARLVIYRASAMGIVVQPDYVVDGKPVASAQPNGFVMCDLPPGRHEVAVDNFPISFTPFSSGSERLAVNLRAGGTTYLSAEPQMGIYTPGKVTLTEVAESQGRADTANMHQLKGACAKA
jgi:Protein of unknown function (DUF2846)